MIRISPSIMCCEAKDFKAWIEKFESNGIDAIHFDVMDGHFVDNMMLGTNDFKDIKKYTTLPIDIHLMCYKPEIIMTYFNFNAGDKVSFHPETTEKSYWICQEIRAKGGKAGIALNPGTPISYIEELIQQLDFILIMTVNPGFAGQKMIPDAINKITRIRELVNTNGRKDIELIVDGNTNIENSIKMLKAGANNLVVGTSSVLNDLENFEKNLEIYIHEIEREI